jgi:hypothetical protein
MTIVSSGGQRPVIGLCWFDVNVYKISFSERFLLLLYRCIYWLGFTVRLTSVAVAAVGWMCSCIPCIDATEVNRAELHWWLSKWRWNFNYILWLSLTRTLYHIGWIGGSQSVIHSRCSKIVLSAFSLLCSPAHTLFNLALCHSPFTYSKSAFPFRHSSFAKGIYVPTVYTRWDSQPTMASRSPWSLLKESCNGLQYGTYDICHSTRLAYIYCSFIYFLRMTRISILRVLAH